MSTRERLEAEKEQLKKDWKDYPDKRDEIERRGKEINILLSNLCATCKEEQRTYNDYYCSKQCETEYYGRPKDEDGREVIPLHEKLKKWKHAREHYKNLVK